MNLLTNILLLSDIYNSTEIQLVILFVFQFEIN